ncbi:MAG: Eco57I restriction-modification methylase domain-containing protein, partial [bacterium]
MITTIEQRRIKISARIKKDTKMKLGQFLTPIRIAQFMADLFKSQSMHTCRLLDPGAGIGSLTCAFLERCTTGELNFKNIEATMFEIDQQLYKELDRSFSCVNKSSNIDYKICTEDFIKEAVKLIKSKKNNIFTHAVLNPPYRKIRSDSHHRALLRQVGIETVNLYSAFVALSVFLLKERGELVAIIPRSFCNGPYYRPFREFILEHT